MTEPRFNHFDADAYLATQEVPVIVVGALVYRGRLLSLLEWLPIAEAIDALDERQKAGGKVPPREFIRVYRKYLRMVFPRRRFVFWAPDPVAELFKLPWGAVTEAIRSFFALQAQASRPRKSPSTSGTDSAPSTRPAGETPPRTS